jgi:single-stranded DNA-binding protein
MNNFVLLAEIIEPVKLRYTQDNQTPVAEVLVQFAGLRPDDPPARLKAVGWNTMAETLQQSCQVGQSVLLEGRLRMNMVDRPEGFKEKVAELTVSRIHSLGGGTGSAAPVAPTSANYSSAVPNGTPSTPSAPPMPSVPMSSTPMSSTPIAPSMPPQMPPPDYDDIPF